MISPYYPFISQNQDLMYIPELSELFRQDSTGQYIPTSRYNELQGSYGIYDDTTSMAIAPLMGSSEDPPPLLSNNPASTNIVLFKELNAYPNYGNPSGNADILYTGNRGTWTFTIPAFLFVPGNLRAQLIIRSVLDDHVNVPANRYSLRISVNNNVVQAGRVFLEHGRPVGGMFTNWRDLTFNIPNLRRVTSVTIENTSNVNADDWIAFDWMQLKLIPR